MLKKMRIKSRLLFGFILVILLMLIITIVSLTELKNSNTNLKNFVNGPFTADSAVKMCRIETNVAARVAREMVLNTDDSLQPQYEEMIAANLTQIEDNLKTLENSGVIDTELIQRYRASISSWIEIANRVIVSVNNNDRAGATSIILKECTKALEEVVSHANAISAITDAAQEKALNKSITIVTIASFIIIALLLLSCIIAVVFAGKIVAGIVNPLKEISYVAEEMSKGNLHAEIQCCTKDEMGELADTLRKSFETITSYISDIDRAMAVMADGEFNLKPAQPFIGDFENIEKSIDRFILTISDVVYSIQNASKQVANGSQQVAATSQELANGAMEQAGVVEELSSAIIDVSSRIKVNASDAAMISTEVVNVSNEIENSNGRMQEMVAAMEEINKTSGEINNIIQTINGIATQTNLLSLNASIEAARAGEAGKGFAVVADQVGKLASESAQAAKTSANLIEASLKAVESGMKIANITANDLKSVVTGSREITIKVNHIAQASEEQAESMEQINSGVEQINAVIQNNSAAAQQSAAASQELTSQADILKNLISKFHPKENM